MSHRHADGDRVQDHLPGRRGQHGGVAADNRRFLDAVLWVARTGAAWADLPERRGRPNSQWRRFDRGAAKGRWGPILAALRDPDLGLRILDATPVRAHLCAAGAEKSPTAPAARTSTPWAGVRAGSGRRGMAASTASATPARGS